MLSITLTIAIFVLFSVFFYEPQPFQLVPATSTAIPTPPYIQPRIDEPLFMVNYEAPKLDVYEVIPVVETEASKPAEPMSAEVDEAPVIADDHTPTAVDYSKWTKKDLLALVKRRGIWLPNYAKLLKADLIRILKEQD
jgi:hypothetical protein